MCETDVGKKGRSTVPNWKGVTDFLRTTEDEKDLKRKKKAVATSNKLKKLKRNGQEEATSGEADE